MRNYDEFDVVQALNKKHDVKIIGKTVSVLVGSLAKCDLGIKAKGKIDFLHRHRGYNVSFVHRFQ